MSEQRFKSANQIVNYRILCVSLISAVEITEDTWIAEEREKRARKQ